MSISGGKEDGQNGHNDKDGNDDKSGKIATIWWCIRLIVAIGGLSIAFMIVGRSFFDQVIQLRSSPIALVLLVVLIQLVWFISHIPAGGLLSSLKIVFGACALVGALVGPKSPSVDWSWALSNVASQRIAVVIFAILVVLDGAMDRRANLRRSYGLGHGLGYAGGEHGLSVIPPDQNPSPVAITTIGSSDR